MNAKAVERIPFDYFAQPCGAQAEIVILLVIDGCPEVYNIVDVGIEGEGKSIAFAEDEFFVTGTGVEIQGCSAVAFARRTPRDKAPIILPGSVCIALKAAITSVVSVVKRPRTPAA